MYSIALFFILVLVAVLFICQFLIMPVVSENGSAGDEMILIVDLWTLLLLKDNQHDMNIIDYCCLCSALC